MKLLHVAIAILALASCLAAPAGFAREKVFEIASFAGSTSNTAVIPESHMAIEWWGPRHQAVLDRVKQGNVDLILLGDSITHGWEQQPELWQKFFAPRNAVNMGFGGDRTQQVLWRLQNGEVDGISPRLAMLMIGTNNSNGDDNTAEEIADGIVAICRALREKLPDAKILLLAIFPRGEGPSPQREKNARASKLASQVADDKMIFFLDINDKFLEPDATLSKEIMPDLLHLSQEGYGIWGEAVDPTIARLMGE